MAPGSRLEATTWATALFAAASDEVRSEHGAIAFRLWQQSQRDPRAMPNNPPTLQKSRSDPARRFPGCCRRVDDFAIWQDRLDAKDVVGRHAAVLQAVRPPELKATLPPMVQINWLEGRAHGRDPVRPRRARHPG